MLDTFDLSVDYGFYASLTSINIVNRELLVQQVGVRHLIKF